MGGYGGTWLPWTAATAAGPAVGAAPGIASMHVLPASACGLAFTAKVLTHLADESARQCGPCMFGLPAIAADLTGLVAGDRHTLGRLERRLPLVTGRGACAHPDGAVRLAASALRVFGQDVTAHLRERRCTAHYGVPDDEVTHAAAD